MSVDPNVMCPGGRGKKIRHCACRDIMNDLGKIMTAVAGKQRVAALNQINRLLATHANRPCLWALKAGVLLEMGEAQQFEEAVATFRQAEPDNKVAHTFATFLALKKKDLPGALDSLQTALSLAKGHLTYELFMAIGDVGRALAITGNYVAARNHMLFRAMIGRNEDAETVLGPLMEITTMDDIPPILKQDFAHEMCPPDVPWASRFQEAIQCLSFGAWREAKDIFEALDRDVPEQPSVVKNLAITRCQLADPDGPKTWLAYAGLKEIPFEKAVDAAALALMMEFDQMEQLVDVVRVTYHVSDANQLQEQLLSSKIVVANQGDIERLREEDAPPPKGAFDLLSGPVPASHEDLQLDDVPTVFGRALLFGRETDREARLEFVLIKDSQFDRAIQVLRDVAGEWITDDGAQEVVDQVNLLTAELFPALQFPDQTPFQRQTQLRDESVEKAFVERWPTIPLKQLDEKTPEQAAQDPAYRIQLAGTVLALEQVAETQHWPIDCNILRTKLGLEPLGPIELGTDDPDIVNPAHLGRVRVDNLPDQQLMDLHRRSAMLNHRLIGVKVSKEMLGRDSLTDRIDKAQLCGSIAQLSRDSDESLDYLRRATEISTARGESPAEWLLGELPLRMLRGESVEAQTLMNRIQTNHLREPGVAEALYKILSHFGLVPQEGEERPPTPEPAAEQQPTEQKIWTPGDPEPQPGEQKESKLWVPPGTE